MVVTGVITNKVKEAEFEDLVESWLSEGDYTSNDVIEDVINERNAELLPLHFYHVRYSGTVSAVLGYPRTEVYYVYNPTTKKQERRTKTVVDWRPYSGPAYGEFPSIQYAGDKGFHFLSEFFSGTRWQANEILVPNADASLQLATNFKYDLKETWDNRVSEKSRDKILKDVKNSLPSTLVKNFNPNIEITIVSTQSVLAPFWIYSYDYKGKQFNVVVDGNNPSRITGDKPTSSKRKALVYFIRLLGVFMTAGIILFMTAYQEQYPPSSPELGYLYTTLAVIAYWFFSSRIVKTIKHNSKQKRAEKLAQRKELRAKSKSDKWLKQD